MTLNLFGRAENETFVFICEDYGYRYWAWFPKMSYRQLVKWWKNLPSVNPYFFSPIGLPGEVFQITELYHIARFKESKHYYCHLHEDGDSYLLTSKLNVVFHNQQEDKHVKKVRSLPAHGG